MASDDEKIEASFSLDADKALDTLSTLKDQITSLGDSENLAGLLEGLAEVGVAVAAVGVAVYAIKESFDIVFDTEKIKNTNTQFELLAHNAGISGDALKEGLLKASDGLIQENELLQVANKAIIAMGGSANKLPQIMELARKVAVATGTDAKTAFDGLTTAIERGSQRMLKQMGINIDLKKAQEDYAKTIGMSGEKLDETQKRQAILNEVLIKGNESLRGIDLNSRAVTDSWTRFKVAMADAAEVSKSAIGNLIGPAVAALAAGMERLAKTWKREQIISHGNAIDANAAKLDKFKEKAQELTENIARLNSELQDEVIIRTGGEGVRKEMLDSQEKELKRTNEQIEATERIIAREEERAMKKMGREKAVGGGKTEVKEKEDDPEAHKKFLELMLHEEKEFYKEGANLALSKSISDMAARDASLHNLEEHQEKVRKIQEIEGLTNEHVHDLMAEENYRFAAKELATVQSSLTSKLEAATAAIQAKKEEADSEEEIDRLELERSLKIAEIEAASIKQIEKLKDQGIIDEQRRTEAITAIHQEAAQARKTDGDATEKAYSKVFDNNLKHAQGFWAQFSGGMAKSTKDSAAKLNNFEKDGEQASSILANRFGTAFEAMGKSGAIFGEQMKNAVLGSIADIATAKGLELIASSIYPPNPLGLAAGAGLLALAGFLKSQITSTSASTVSSSGAGGAGGGAPTPPVTATTPYGVDPAAALNASNAITAAAAPQKSISINIAGNYFETEQTRTRLVELIRENADATDFKIQSIGGGL